MQYSLSKALAASTLLFAAGAHGLGYAVVKNKCEKPIYLWSVSDVQSSMKTIPNSHTVYNETFRTNPNGGGIVLKMSDTHNGGNLPASITQYEYTLSAWANNAFVFYDLSNINNDDNPLSVPYSLKPDDDSCASVICPAGGLCTGAYNDPTQNAATHACSQTANIVFEFCPDAADSSSGSTSSAPATSPSATAIQHATTTAAAAPVVQTGLLDDNVEIANANPVPAAVPAPAPVAKVATPNKNSQSSSGSSNNGPITYISFDTEQAVPSKRDIHDHAAPQHVHSGVKRSRVFRSAA